MEIEAQFQEAKSKMEKAIDSLKKDFSKVRTGRANPSILDSVRIDYYGVSTPINQLGNISVPDAQLIIITPWEKKVLPDIERAIFKADVGLTPQNDGKVIKITIPALSEERRKEMVKLIKKIAEGHKTSVRNIRRDANNAIKTQEKDKILSEDQSKKESDRIQKITDHTISAIDQLTQEKEKELLQV